MKIKCIVCGQPILGGVICSMPCYVKYAKRHIQGSFYTGKMAYKRRSRYTPVTPAIWWDNSSGRWAVRTPLNEDWLKEFKFFCDNPVEWDEFSKVWFFVDEDLDIAREVTARYFPNYVFKEKIQPQPPILEPARIADPIETILNFATEEEKALPHNTKEEIQKIYRRIMRRMHPDINPNANHDDVAQVNIAWTALERSLRNGNQH